MRAKVNQSTQRGRQRQMRADRTQRHHQEHSRKQSEQAARGGHHQLRVQ